MGDTIKKLEGKIKDAQKKLTEHKSKMAKHEEDAKRMAGGIKIGHEAIRKGVAPRDMKEKMAVTQKLIDKAVAERHKIKIEHDKVVKILEVVNKQLVEYKKSKGLLEQELASKKIDKKIYEQRKKALKVALKIA